MAKKIQAIRGMHDILPEQVQLWHLVERNIKQVMDSYGYQEIRPTVVEKTELFKRSIGEVTDIVEKEMYDFVDRNGDSLALRPEGTAGCLRACIEHGLLYKQMPRLWYYGAMFRHERPQKGRYRQFYQFGVEVYGAAGPDIDAEIIVLAERLWKNLGVADKIELQINTLGTTEERLKYRSILIDYFSANTAALDADSRRRLQTNPLRILDSKNPDMQTLIVQAPMLLQSIGLESQAHFKQLQVLLDALEVKYIVNPRLVRGLDYYGKTVFEWVTDALGAQGTVGAGGRYDNLVEQLSGRNNYAIGFAVGIERLIALLQANPVFSYQQAIDVYMIQVGVQIEKAGLTLAESIRGQLPSLKMQVNCGGGSYKSQFKKADKSGAQIVLILGEDELANSEIGVKSLRIKEEQQNIAQSHIVTYLKQALKL